MQVRLDRDNAQYEKPMEKPYQLNIVLRINFTALIATAAVVDSVYGWKMQVTAHPRR